MKTFLSIILSAFVVLSMTSCSDNIIVKARAVNPNSYGVHKLVILEVHKMFNVGDTIMSTGNNRYAVPQPYVIVSKQAR